MSEVKRVASQPLELSSSLGNAAKKEKKEKGKQLAPSFRFELLLDDKNEKGYFEFTYINLLKNAEKKKLKELKNLDENAANGLDPFDDDDDEKLKEIARKFEAKYGTPNVVGKKKKYDDDVDLGAGYDENDSFIDNTDAYDEVVPEGVTTAHGGFYINSGPLEFSVKENAQVSLHRNNDNDDDSSESSDDDEDSNSPDSKRRERDLSSSDEDDTEDINGPLPKKSKLDENTEKKSNYDNVVKKKKRILTEHPSGDSINREKPLDDKPENMEVDNFVENSEERKKLQCDASRSKEKKLIKKSMTNGIEDKKVDLKKGPGKDTNIDDAIESVVNDGKMEDESSRDTVDSGKSRCIAGTSSECEDADKVDVRMPENMPEDIKDIITKLKKHAENSKEGKIKFFDTFVNNTLLSLEKKLRLMDSPAVRSQVYGHLAHFLSCSKVTLANRAKKLCLQDAESRIKEPVQRLKVIIDRSMPALLQRYDQECQKAVNEKGMERLSDGNSSDGTKSEKSKIPRKRFHWSSEAKKLVSEIADVWRQYYKIRRPRKESIEQFVAAFMQSKLVPLWPQGWMRIEFLMAVSKPELIATRKKKSRDTSVPDIANNCSTKEVNQKQDAKSPYYEESENNYIIQKPSGLEITLERKQSSKHKDKVKENSSSNQQDAAPVAKISLVPTSQLMAHKPTKNHSDKFNPIDLTSSSLSITPVNDYQRHGKSIEEVKKDVISIIGPTYGDSTTITSISDHSSYQGRPDMIYAMSSQSGSKPVSLKQRILQDSVNVKDKRDERECEPYPEKETRRDRWIDDKYKSSYDIKKKRKEHKIESQPQRVGLNLQSQSLSKEEQEKRQIEETMAATNYLSQIINDDVPRLNEKKKDDETINNILQPSEQEKDVQMVMRSLKELQELQEMKFSPNHSPLQKPTSSHQYTGYTDEYHRLYHKKDDKIRVTKDEPQWS